MTETLLNYNKYQCAYIIPDEDSDDNIELEEGFIEEEEEDEDWNMLPPFLRKKK